MMSEHVPPIVGRCLLTGLLVTLGAGSVFLRVAKADQTAQFHLRWAEQAFSDARSGPSDAELPFSFVYGGKSSRELVRSWKKASKSDSGDPVRRLTLTLSDPATNLEVRAVAKVYLDTPAVDWTLHFTNKGTRDSLILEQVNAVDVPVRSGALDSPAVLSRLHSHAENWVPFDEPVAQGTRIDFAPTNGRSSDGASPFFNVSWKGGGVVTALGWTGQWRASVEQTADSLRVTGGMQDMRLKLRPGETIRSPRVLQVYWFGDDPWHAYNRFRQVMFAHIMPRVNGQLVVPPVAHLSTAFYECDKGTETDVLSHLASLKGLGFEYFWLDAYYGKDDFPIVGNYVFPLLRGMNQTRFPKGLKPIADAVHREGLKFLLWFEPERICPGTLMAKEHPAWVVLPKDGKGGMFNAGWGMFNLAVPDARRYLTRYINVSIKEYGIDCVRFDNAVYYRELWEQVDQATPDRRGMAEIRYVEGLYRMWDEILATNPSVFIDNCASGGGRIDLETCARSIPLWRTDATIDPLLKKNFHQAAIQNQAMTAGLSRYVPFSTSGQMGATPYLFRSGLNAGGVSFAEDIRPPDYPRDLLKQAIAEAKRLRPYFFGNLYVLTEVTVRPEDWCVWQYHRVKEQDGLVLAFRRHAATSADLSVTLHEIDPAADYHVTRLLGYEPDKPVKIRGTDLKHLRIEIPEQPGSVVIEYRKLL